MANEFKLNFIPKIPPKFKLILWTREGEIPLQKEAGSWVVPINTSWDNTFLIIRLDDTDLFHMHLSKGKFVRLNITRTAMRQFDSE